MANAPDDEAANYDSIEVISTPDDEHPKFGAVTVRFTRDFHRTTIRLSTEDAETLLARLASYLDN